MAYMENQRVTILGIGCMLFADQGFGVSVVQTLNDQFDFPEFVQVVDGGLIGVGLVGTIAQSTHLIVVDIMSNKGNPGDLFRLEGQKIFERLAAKNHVQQVEFLEALAHCQALDCPPKAVLLAIEPEDTESVSCEPTPLLLEKKEAVIDAVLTELDRLGVSYRERVPH